MKQFSLRQFLLILFVTLSFSISSVFAEGTYMLPKAINLYNSGECREAYNLAYRIGIDNPQCWQACEVKALSALALNNPGEALTNINKAISIKVPDPYYLNTKEACRLYIEHSIILFNLAYDNKSTSINPQYEKSILKDVEEISYRNQGYLMLFMHYVNQSMYPISIKVRLFTKMLAVILNNEEFYRDEFPCMHIYCTALQVVLDANDEEINNLKQTKTNLLQYIKRSTKITNNTGNSSSISLHNDLTDMFYFLILKQYDNFNYAYNGIKNNINNDVYYYYIEDLDEFIKRVTSFVNSTVNKDNICFEYDDCDMGKLYSGLYINP